MPGGAERKRFVIGIVGGFCPAAIADLYLKLTARTPFARQDSDYFDILVTSDPHQTLRGTELQERTRFYDVTHRLLYVYQVAKMLETQHADIIVVPDFITHSGLPVLRGSIRTPLLDLVESLAETIGADHPQARRIGVLTTTHCVKAGVFGAPFRQRGLEPVFPDDEIQERCMMEALYGEEGLKNGHFSGRPAKLIAQACEHLRRKGAEVIAFGVTELPLVPRGELPGIPYADCNEAAARMVHKRIAALAAPKQKTARLGILGGLGPSATVDLFNKIVRATPARRDQDHLKIVIENDPSVPDRTQALLHQGEDPSVALLAGARRLEEAGVALIVCPCNTAHAFLGKVAQHISTPILHLPQVVAEHLATQHPAVKIVGLLATDGTIQSGVYAEVLEARGLTTLAPDAEHQRKVMEAIYGEHGIKAGWSGPEPRELLRDAARHLAERGAEAVIMGCTEIPLALKSADAGVPLLDATAILAERAVLAIRQA